MKKHNLSSGIKYRLTIRTLLMLLGSLWFQPVLAAPTNEQWQAFNLAVIDQHITPRYQQLAHQADELLLANTTLCQTLDESSLNASKKAYNLTMDAWQGIQHIRFGPVETLMRIFSMQYWPDKKNHIGKHLESLISSNDDTLLSSDRFYGLGISVKGLPAIERILYADDALAKLKADPFRCKVNIRIAAYVAEMGRDTELEWQTVMRPHFQDVNSGDDYFEEDLEASTLILKALVEPLEVIRDLKIDRPLGKSADNVKYKRLESWRSARSLRNIVLNISALEALYKGDVYQDDGSNKGLANVQHLLETKDSNAIALQFKALKSQLEKVPSPLKESIRTEEGRKALLLASEMITGLHNNLEKTLAANGIHLGFNSRDGD